MTIAYWLAKIKSHQTELFTILVVLLVGALGFGLGQWSRLASARTPVRIENIPLAGERIAPKAVPVPSQPSAAVPSPAAAGENFVASKSGAKYYPVGCASANRIKKENQVFFASAGEAEAAGYGRSSVCK